MPSVEIGYKLSSEEHGPAELVDYAVRAEAAGFTFGAISDHFHPWVDKQGHSPFVWSVLGAIARATTNLRALTGVTCPTIRTHPAIVAHAVATTSIMFGGRFSFGVGSGENLNEHVLGDKWPPADVRLEMLEEAVAVMRRLWKGGMRSFRGRYYTVENARIFDLPDEPPPVLVAAGGKKAIELAARIGDGLISTSPDREALDRFADAGGKGKPRYAEIQVCWAETDDRAIEIATEWWPNVAITGQLTQDLATPALFEQAAAMIDADDVAAKVACGPDRERHIAMIEEYIDAGYDHIWVHQIGPEQRGFFDFYEREVLPKFL